MALPWILIQYGTDGVIPSVPATNGGPPPWGLIGYGTDGGAVPPVVPPILGGGGLGGGWRWKRHKKIIEEAQEVLALAADAVAPQILAPADRLGDLLELLYGAPGPKEASKIVIQVKSLTDILERMIEEDEDEVATLLLM